MTKFSVPHVPVNGALPLVSPLYEICQLNVPFVPLVLKSLRPKWNLIRSDNSDGLAVVALPPASTATAPLLKSRFAWVQAPLYRLKVTFPFGGRTLFPVAVTFALSWGLKSWTELRPSRPTRPVRASRVAGE